MLTEEEYKKEWLQGLHQTEYNACRFSENKIQFAKDWILSKYPELNIEQPTNIFERINNYKLYDKDIRKPIFADKIACLDELRKMNLSDIIIEPVYTSYKPFTIEDYKNLPNGKYIFKCNHGSGWNIKHEKTDISNPTYLINKLNEWYTLNYAYICGWEWHYNEIKPGIIIQPDISIKDIPLMDWSFWCENGNIELINLTRKFSKNIEESILECNEDGEEPEFIIGIEPLRIKASKLEKQIIDKMKPIVKKLAQDFKFVRVDLYYVNEKIYFGELTFTPCSGNLNYITVENYKRL